MIDLTHEKVTTRDINESQKRAVRRILQYYIQRNEYTHCTSVRFELVMTASSLLSIVVNTRRSDCQKYSPRQIICAQRLFAFIGIRGGIKVKSAETYHTSEIGHLRIMLGCKI